MQRCPICDFKFQGRGYKKSLLFPKFQQCQNCSGLFLLRKIAVNYPKKYFREEGKSLFVTLAKPLLDFFYSLRVKKIISHLKAGHDQRKVNILDYGCGWGKLVMALRQSGFNAIGYEPSKGALSLATEDKLPIFNKLKKISTGYDLIMFWHSLEHISRPLQIIQQLKKNLKKNGELLIAVPNVDSFEANLTKEAWFHYSFPLHQIHLTPKAANLMLKKIGFKIVSWDFLNPEYTVSGLVQSFLNIFLPKDTLYTVFAHRRLSLDFKKAWLIALLSIVLTLIFAPLLFLFFLVSLIFKKTGAIVIIADNE